MGIPGRHRAPLLASTAFATLTLGAGAAGAACYSGPFPATNAGTVSGICVIDSTFTGTVENSGVVTTDGITVTNSHIGTNAVGGRVVNSGTLSGGISIDAASSITATGGDSAVLVSGPLAGGISNAGTLSGFGGIEAVNFTTFTGGISNSGTIDATVGISLFAVGSFSGGITNSGTIAAPGNGAGILISDIGSFAGNIVNTGTITGQGGIAIGANVNFVGGASIINSGKILGGVGAIDVGDATGPVAIFQNAGLMKGTILLSPFGGGLTVSGGTIQGNIFDFGSANTLAFNLGSGSFVYDSAYQFTGLNRVEINSGAVVLNGTNSATEVAVHGGTLQVGDAGHAGATLTTFFPVIVSGTLSGYGTVIGGVEVDAGGVLAPGGGANTGTLSITGNLVLASAAAYLIQVSGTSASKTVVSGTAVIDGTLKLSGAGRAGTYVILSASSVTGTFSAVTGSVAGATNARLVYTADEVALIMDTAPLALAGLPRNAGNVASGLNTIIAGGGTLPMSFQPLYTFSGNDYAEAMSLLSGEAATGAQQGAFQMMTGFLGLMHDPFVEGRNGWGGATGIAAEVGVLPADVAAAYAAVLKAPPVAPSSGRRWSLWGGAYGGANRTEGDAANGGSHDLSARTAGFAAGADYGVTPFTTVGFALAGGGTNWSLAQGHGGGRSDVFQAGVHAKTTFGSTYVATAFGFAEHWVSTSRTTFAADTLTAKFNAHSFGGRVEAGHRLATPTAAVTPYVAAQAQAFVTPSYSETDASGGGFGLTYAGRTATATRAEAGARFERITAIDPTTLLTLRGRLGYAHDWVSDPTLAATFQTLPGASFIVAGASPARDSVLASAGVELHLAGGWTFAGRLDGEFAAHSQTYSGIATARFHW